MKPGVYTSEFLLSVVTIVAASVALFTGGIDADKWILVVTGATGAYNLSRGLAKVTPPKDTGDDVFGKYPDPNAAH